MGKPHNGVLIVTVPDDWKPQRFHNLPPAILSARYYARGNPIHISLEIAKAFNRARLQPGGWTGEWALMVRTLKTRGWGAPTRVDGLIPGYPRPDIAAGSVEGGGI